MENADEPHILIWMRESSLHRVSHFTPCGVLGTGLALGTAVLPPGGRAWQGGARPFVVLRMQLSPESAMEAYESSVRRKHIMAEHQREDTSVRETRWSTHLLKASEKRCLLEFKEHRKITETFYYRSFFPSQFSEAVSTV